MPPLNIPSYGDVVFDTPEEYDRYVDFFALFVSTPGTTPHTNMDSQVRLGPNNPLLTAKINDAGLTIVEILPIDEVTWDAEYTQEANPILSKTKTVVDKYSSQYSQEDYYAQANANPPCGNPCEIVYVLNQEVKILNLNTSVFSTLVTLPYAAGAIASTSGKFYMKRNTEIEEYTIDYNNCSASLSRSIPTPAPWNFQNVCLCAKDSTTLIGGGHLIGNWIVEYDVGAVPGPVTPRWQMGGVNPPSGYASTRISGGIIYLPTTQEVLTSELWEPLTGGIQNRLVVRSYPSGTIITSCSSFDYVWGLFCFDGGIYGMKWDTISPANRGVFNIQYNPAGPTLGYNTAFIHPESGGGASSDPGCCNPLPVAPTYWAGYCCSDSQGNSPVFGCVNATANCGGNNCDGVIAVCLECVGNCGALGFPMGISYDVNVIDANGIVVASALGSTVTIANLGQLPYWFQWGATFCVGTYTVAFTNLVIGGIPHADINVSCTVLGDTPLTCATNIQCCPPMWNCTNCNCYPVSGTGQYATLAECQLNCCPPPPPAGPGDDPCSDFDVCIDCNNY